MSWLAISGRLMEKQWHWRLRSSPPPLGIHLEILQRRSLLAIRLGNSRYILSALVQLFSDIFSHKNIGLITVSTSQAFASYRGGSSLWTNSNKDTSYSATSHVNLRNCIINILPTAFISSSRASICLHILHRKEFISVDFRLIPSGQSRRLLVTLERKFARIVICMRILLNEGFCMPS